MELSTNIPMPSARPLNDMMFRDMSKMYIRKNVETMEMGMESPMMSVLSLLASFFCLSVIYLLAGMQFIAAAQILVYAGAILVLFLFVIMLLNLGSVTTPLGERPALLRRRPARVGAALALAIGLMGLIAAQKSSLEAPDRAGQETGIDAIPALAGELFGRYSLAFEAAGMLLLATMIAVIVLVVVTS